jgi:hypothetical protein
MKRMERQRWLLVFILALTFSITSYSQKGITGIWKGYFITDQGEHYKLEFQVKQSAGLAVKGVSYSYLDIRFYGKASMTGSYLKSSNNFRIREIRTVEVKSTTGGGTCIMNYDLVYSTSGKEEFLEGTYLGKQEVKGRPNPYTWGDCGSGRVFLRKVQTSDFYVEPFLRKDVPSRPATRNNPKTADTPAKKNVPVSKPPSRPPAKKDQPPVTTVKPDTRQTHDSTLVKKPEIPVIKGPVRTPVITPAILKERKNELMKALVVNTKEVVVKLYDNGEIDDDSISIFYDNRLLVSHKRLSAVPITLKLNLGDDDEDHELVMVAENLGRIPPNTSLMIVEAGDQRFDVRITSTEQKNALVRFRYRQP